MRKKEETVSKISDTVFITILLSLFFVPILVVWDIIPSILGMKLWITSFAIFMFCAIFNFFDPDL